MVGLGQIGHFSATRVSNQTFHSRAPWGFNSCANLVRTPPMRTRQGPRLEQRAA
jgi:hypothetical protein